jgi:cell wall-associated NlpC family hydrolase
VSAMLGAPDDFLSQVDTARNQDLAAGLVVDRAADDDTAAALARASAMAARTLVDGAAATVRTARTDVAAARRALKTAESGLAALASVAPQTQIGPDGCPRTDVAGTLRGGAEAVGARRLCRAAVAGAATPQAALALQWAFSRLGAAYACGGAGRMLPGRMDCSSLVSRAYHEGAGLGVAGSTWAPSTRDMVPWDGVALDPHYAPVPTSRLAPGDLVLYDTGGATYRHVVMYLGMTSKGGQHWMLHTNSCGDVAKVEPFWGFPTTGSHTFLVARRVQHLPTDPARLRPIR